MVNTAAPQSACIEERIAARKRRRPSWPPLRVTCFAACCLFLLPPVLHAQQPFPRKPMRVVVAFTPGIPPLLAYVRQRSPRCLGSSRIAPTGHGTYSR